MISGNDEEEKENTLRKSTTDCSVYLKSPEERKKNIPDESMHWYLRISILKIQKPTQKDSRDEHFVHVTTKLETKTNRQPNASIRHILII